MGESALLSDFPGNVHEGSISMRAGELMVSVVFGRRVDDAGRQRDVPEKVRTIARNIILVLPLGPVLGRNFHGESSDGSPARGSSITQ